MSLPELPAYFMGGSHDGELMAIGGMPWTFHFPVMPDMTAMIQSYLREEFPQPVMVRTDDYNLVRPVLLYKYAGRFPK